MINAISEGKTISVRRNPTRDGDINSGDPVQVGHIFGVAATSVVKNDPRYPFGGADDEREFELYIQGVFALKSDASTFAVGDKVFFDPVTKLVTATATATTPLIGIATESIKREESLVRVRLNGISL